MGFADGTEDGEVVYNLVLNLHKSCYHEIIIAIRLGYRRRHAPDLH